MWLSSGDPADGAVPGAGGEGDSGLENHPGSAGPDPPAPKLGSGGGTLGVTGRVVSVEGSGFGGDAESSGKSLLGRSGITYPNGVNGRYPHIISALDFRHGLVSTPAGD